MRLLTTPRTTDHYNDVTDDVTTTGSELSDSDEKGLGAKCGDENGGLSTKCVARSKREIYQQGWEQCARFLDKLLTLLYLIIQSMFLFAYLVVGYQMAWD